MSSWTSWAAAFADHLAMTSPEPLGLVVDHALGPWLVTPEGRRYLDLLSGIGVANVGHTHPEVVRAVEAQNRRHHHVMVYGEVVQEEQARFAAELAAVLPPALDRVYFVNSGTEAVEGALKTARKHTGRAGFVSFRGGYHGDTMGSLSVCGHSAYQSPFVPLVGPVTRLPYGDASALGAVDRSVAAVIVEPVQGEGGVRIPDPGFLPALRARCTETGALLVLDEVLTGFGRTGRLFAFEHSGVVPDLLVLAKALGGGYPLGAFVGSSRVLRTLTHDPPLAHVTTFGGHPVSCAAGRAALRVLLAEDLSARAERVGAQFLAALRERLGGLPAVVEVRGIGMLVGIQLASAAATTEFVRRCRDRGLIVGWTLHHDTIVRLAPPLVTPEEVLLDAVRTMGDVLEGIR